MSTITEQQAAFAEHYVANGGNGSAAAIAAGYSEHSSRQAAYKLIRIPHVETAIRLEQRRCMTGLVTIGLAKLKAVLENPETRASVILDAVIKLADRVGLGPKPAGESLDDPKEIEDMTLAELNAFIRVRESENGVAEAPARDTGHRPINLDNATGGPAE